MPKRDEPKLSESLDVLNVIFRHTKDDPIVAEKITLLTHIRDKVITDIVSISASKGVPVGSNGRGYFKWRNKEERDEYIATEKARIQAIGRKLSGIKKSALKGELTLFEQGESDHYNMMGTN